jgi:hypothetical protein
VLGQVKHAIEGYRLQEGGRGCKNDTRTADVDLTKYSDLIILHV